MAFEKGLVHRLEVRIDAEELPVHRDVGKITTRRRHSRGSKDLVTEKLLQVRGIRVVVVKDEPRFSGQLRTVRDVDVERGTFRIDGTEQTALADFHLLERGAVNHNVGVEPII